MDRRERTLNVVNALNRFNSGNISSHNLVSEVCDYFDFIKSETLTSADKRFLMHLSCKAGIPHYFDILYKFNESSTCTLDDESIGLHTISSIFYEATLYTDENSKLHQYQLEILNLFDKSKQNRFFLSASTSFGKTHLAYEVIKKINYKNIVLIFPSIALLTENLAKIKEKKITLIRNYSIHTLSDENLDYGEYNIFLFTPERFLSFLDKDTTGLDIDFIFVDEVYKIDNGYIIDNEAKENERDVAYRMAIFYGLAKYKHVDLLLAGPYIEIFKEDSEFYNSSFDLFLTEFKIEKLLRNEFEIVKVHKHQIEGIKSAVTLDDILFDFTKKVSKRDRIQELLDRLISIEENSIVYCNTQAVAEKVAREFKKETIDTTHFDSFFQHLKLNYHNDWVVIKALEKGVAIHHGVVPKYIQRELVSLFNLKNSPIKVLTSTTTITEGVNTTAKNMLVYKSEKGSGRNGKPLLTFDAKNIAGRAGRFMEHYTGRVISLDKEFIDKINEVGHQIEHTNYKAIENRKEIDYDMTPSQFLDDRSRQKMEEIKILQTERGIPDNIMTQFKVITRREKLKIYDKIVDLPPLQKMRITTLVSKLNSPNFSLDKDGFQVVLDLIYESIENENLKMLISNKFNDKYTPNSYSIIYAALNSYLRNGFNGVFNYHLSLEQKNGSTNAVDTAMRRSASLIYNTFKYQLVKYLGVFNLMYKYNRATILDKSIDDVFGIDRLLVKLEYNAFSEQGRIASDYGVPQKIVDYYDSGTPQQGLQIFNSFDRYELEIYKRINSIIEN